MDKTIKDPPLNNSDEISLKEVILKLNKGWRYLLSKWVTIVIAGAIGGALGLTYSLFEKPIYKAELSFALQDEKSAGGGLSGALGLASQFGLDLGGGSVGGEFSGDNLLALMKSRLMIERTLLTPVIFKEKKQTLAEVYISFNKLRENWSNRPKLKNVQFLPDANPRLFTLTQDSLLGVFYKKIILTNVTVEKADKKASIITLAVKSTNEFFSKTFAEVLEKVVSDFYIQTKTEKASKNVKVIQRQTDSVRRMLNAAISGVASSADVNPNPNPLLQILRVPSQTKTVEVQANTAILSEMVKNLEISKMSLLQETPLIQVIDKPILPLDKERLGKTKGLILGGLISGFLAAFVLITKRIFKGVMD